MPESLTLRWFDIFQGIQCQTLLRSNLNIPYIRYNRSMDVLAIVGVILLGLMTAAVFWANNH